MLLKTSYFEYESKTAEKHSVNIVGIIGIVKT